MIIKLLICILSCMVLQYAEAQKKLMVTPKQEGYGLSLSEEAQ